MRTCVWIGILGIGMISFLSNYGKASNSMNKASSAHTQVVKKVLDNGMTILIRPVHHVPKVSVQLWYNVGSKDEKSGEKGLAHLIEHMIFKGTDTLSESDINVVTHMLSGNCNAFTSYDYTGYLFNMPKHHWSETLPVMADCMRNARFDDNMLNSEMKAVIQELKMYKDNYSSSLFEHLVSTIFEEHPYHYPIIGYKQDLWGASGEVLHKFYKKHYVPNNATLVVVGDVDLDEVYELAQKHFSPIPADKTYKKEQNYINKDIVSKSVTLYRDLQQPFVAYAFTVPGLKDKKDHVLNLISWALGKGKSSRLYKKLVNDLQIATSVSADNDDLFEHGIFFIACEPKDIADIPKIEETINQELAQIIKEGFTLEEVNRAIKQTEMTLYNLLENSENQAYQIGKYFLATGDENYAFNYLQQPVAELQKEMQEVVAMYFRPTVMHKGQVLPLPQEDMDVWAKLQAESDAEDNRILEAHPRTTAIEPPVYANSLTIKEAGVFDFPKPEMITLSNGLKVLYHHNPNTPKIDVILQLKARSFYDPQEKQGLYTFMTDMLTEGTKNYSEEQLANIIESRGMALGAYPGGVSMRMIDEDFGFGMQMLHEVLSNSSFDKKHIEKVRAQVLADIKNYWDEPWSFSGQLLREQLYKNHPYNKNSMGIKEVIEKISRNDLYNFYKQVVTPHGATLAIVGNLEGHDLKKELEQTIGTWQGQEVEDIKFSQIESCAPVEVNHPINRDQIVLCFAGLSIDRKHADYDKLLLFDQIFGGGALGSMSSRLFQLREQSGLFYRINGSLIAGADEQPGVVLVKTIVSLDRLAEAEKVIKHAIDTVVDTLTEQELGEAKRAVANALIDGFASNRGIAHMFLVANRYGFAPDFFDKRAEQLADISLDDIKKAVKRVMSSDKLLTLRVGRVESQAVAS